MSSRHAIAIDLGRRRVRALLASQGRERLKVRRVLIEDIPADLNVDDPQTLGRWVGERLVAAHFPRGRAVVAIGREHVGLKRMTLPTTEDAELPDMTRLAMQRELPFAAETAVIDFIPVERSATATTVLAVAVPQTVIDFARNVCKAAGLGIERISLRAMGAAALLRGIGGESGSSISDSESQAQAGPTDPKSSSALAVDVTGEGVEFCLVADGSIRFSRAAEVPQPQDRLAIADAVVTETRRTWMSYRIGENTADVDVAIIMGDRRVSAYAAAPVGEMLKIPVQVLESHPSIDADGKDLDRFWPLAGLLLEPSLNGELIDFANPRKAPDLAMRRRMRGYVAAFLVLAVIGMGWTLARKNLHNLQRDADQLKVRVQTESPANARYGRDLFKLEHLKKWQSVGVDWLKHATYLSRIAPAPDKIVLDSWTGMLDFRGVTYNRKTNVWSANEELTIVIDGEARDRQTADAFREALVQASIYTTSTSGGDAKGGKRMPFGFTYRLRTRENSPAEPAANPAEPPSPAAAKNDRATPDAAPSPSPSSSSMTTATGMASEGAQR